MGPGKPIRVVNTPTEQRRAQQETWNDMTESELLQMVQVAATARTNVADSGQVLAGRRSVEELLRREYTWILRMCAVEIRDSQLVLECVQESLIQIAKALPRFDGRSQLRTWMFTIVRRTSIRFRSQDQRRQAMFPLGKLDDVAKEYDHQPGNHEPSDLGLPIDALLIRSEEQRGLLAIIRTLPEKQRYAVMFHYFEDLSVEEVAKRLGSSPGTVKTHLFRARERIKNILEGQVANE